MYQIAFKSLAHEAITLNGLIHSGDRCLVYDGGCYNHDEEFRGERGKLIPGRKQSHRKRESATSLHQIRPGCILIVIELDYLLSKVSRSIKRLASFPKRYPVTSSPSGLTPMNLSGAGIRVTQSRVRQCRTIRQQENRPS